MLPSAQEHPITHVPGGVPIPYSSAWDKQERDPAEPYLRTRPLSLWYRQQLLLNSEILCSTSVSAQNFCKTSVG